MVKYIISKNPKTFNHPMLGYSSTFSDFGKNNNFDKESMKKLKESGRDKELLTYVQNFRNKVKDFVNKRSQESMRSLL